MNFWTCSVLNLSKANICYFEYLSLRKLTPSLIISSLSDSTIPFIRRENGKLPPQFHYKNHGWDLSGDGETYFRRHRETIRTAEQSRNVVPPVRSPPQESKPPFRPLRRPEADNPRRSRDGIRISGGSAPLHRGQVPRAEANALEVQPRRLRRGDAGDSESDLASAQEHAVAHREDGEMVGGSGGTWREESRWSVRGDAEDGD